MISELLLAAMVVVESNGVPRVGDHGKAHGYLQIHQEVIDDVNRFTGRTYTIRDCYDLESSKEIARVYLEHYARGASDEVKARIWNAGKRGYELGRGKEYWRKVRHELNRGAVFSNKN